MKNFIFDSFSKIGGDHLLWRWGARRLRILCYHGVCEDRFAGQPWIPQFFVTKTAFESQLQYLTGNAHVLPLKEAINRLADGSLPPRSVALTFDDGYANNFHLAYPLLQKYRAPATVFVSTAYAESGELYPFLKLRLIRLYAGGEAAVNPLPNYKSSPFDRIMECLAQWWPQVSDRLEADQRQTLRPLTVEELLALKSPLIDFGAHTHNHCILGNEAPERRKFEICTSISRMSQWAGRRISLFSYPNGQLGDFADIDKAALKSAGVSAAVSGISGANGSHSDHLALRRYPVGIFHSDGAFRAEVTGLRHVLVKSMGRVGR